MRWPRLVTLGAVIVVGLARARRRRRGHPVPAEPGQLRYHVPVGQDPAAVLTSVRQHGFAATVEMAGGDEDVVITCDRAVAREQLRSILAAAPIDMNGHAFDGPPVTFADE